MIRYSACIKRALSACVIMASIGIASVHMTRKAAALNLVLAGFFFGAWMPVDAMAQTPQGAMSVAAGQSRIARGDALIVVRDNGGLLVERMRHLSALRRSGQRVEIRGQCVSACTLYLGLPRTCVSRDIVMGFHGPQSELYGIALPPDEFEYWSRVMADHYPAPLRRWFLAEGRHEIMGVHRIRGRELIRLGVPECS